MGRSVRAYPFKRRMVVGPVSVRSDDSVGVACGLIEDLGSRLPLGPVFSVGTLCGRRDAPFALRLALVTALIWR